MQPVDLFGYGLSRSEPAKQGSLPLGPQADFVAVEIAVAHLPWSSLILTRRNNGSTMRSSSRITGPIRAWLDQPLPRPAAKVRMYPGMPTGGARRRSVSQTRNDVAHGYPACRSTRLVLARFADQRQT